MLTAITGLFLQFIENLDNSLKPRFIIFYFILFIYLFIYLFIIFF